MKKVRTLIVDDEREARDGLQQLLSENPSVEVIGVCESGVEAIVKIDSLRPDLVLLDIKMPDIDGFQVLNSVQPPLPSVIFVTAHDDYALKAFEVHAVDYLLKPFAKARLEEAISHALKILPAQTNQKLLGIARELAGRGGNVLPENSLFAGRLVIKADGKVHFLAYESIRRVEAYDYYVKVYVAERYYLVRDSIKRMEQRLPADLFVRIHRSHIVNTTCITQVVPLGNNDMEVVLSSGERLRGSRNYTSELKKW